MTDVLAAARSMKWDGAHRFAIYPGYDYQGLGFLGFDEKVVYSSRSLPQLHFPPSGARFVCDNDRLPRIVELGAGDWPREIHSNSVIPYRQKEGETRYWRDSANGS